MLRALCLALTPLAYALLWALALAVLARDVYRNRRFLNTSRERV
jgi:hypothetical protein